MTALRRLVPVAAAVALSLPWAVAPTAAQEPTPREVVFTAPADRGELRANTATFKLWLPLSPSEAIRPRTVVELRLRPVGRPGPVTVVPQELQGSGAPCREVTFKDVALPTNGQYEAFVTVRERPSDPVVGTTGQCQGASAEPRTVFVGAPPRTPTGTKAELSPGLRAVAVSWAYPNPEPDVSYRVERAKGGGPFERVGEVKTTTLLDRDPGAGEFVYRVIAVRPGSGAPGAPAFLESGPSDPSAKVTVAPPGPAPSAGSGLKRFSSPAPPRPSAPKYLTPGETGFSETLPFGGSAQVIEEPGAGEAQVAQELGTEEARSDTRRSLGLLAAGLLATVLAMHLLWVKSEVDREPLEVLGPE